MGEAYEPQDWQRRLPPEKEAAMRAKGRVYRPPQSELDDPYEIEYPAILVVAERNKASRAAMFAGRAATEAEQSSDDTNRLAP